MATYSPCELNYEKGNSNSLEILPNELILNIFTHLRIKDLGRCAQVSKTIYAIAYDKTLWTKILVTSGKPPEQLVPPCGYAPPRIMPHGLLVQALSRGARYLGLSNLSFISPSQPTFPPTNQVEYLDLSGSFMNENYFRHLILSCHNLKKLSLADTYGAWKSVDIMKGILQNSNSLRVLDLSGCCKLKPQDVKSVMSSCLNLTEANFSYNVWDIQVPNLSVIYGNFPPSIKKLGLSGAAIGINAITTLITRCNKLTDLDLTDAHIIDEPENNNIRFPTKTHLESLYMRGFDVQFTHLDKLIPSCENSLKVLDISYCENMTLQAIQLIVSRCLYLTAVDFMDLKYAAFICKNLTTNIEKISLSHTDISNEDIKMLVSRCNKIKELDISHTKIVINEVVDEITFYLSSTLKKLSVPTTHSSRLSRINHCPLFKLGSMPKLNYLRSFVRSKTFMKRLMDLWEIKFPDVVLSCHDYFSCHNHNNYTQYCGLAIIPKPNIAKTMSVQETIWEIPCEGIELSELQDDSEESKNSASISNF